MANCRACHFVAIMLLGFLGSISAHTTNLSLSYIIDVGGVGNVFLSNIACFILLFFGSKCVQNSLFSHTSV
jgi:hypothetical protein